jgi:hypothetical protein
MISYQQPIIPGARECSRSPPQTTTRKDQGHRNRRQSPALPAYVPSLSHSPHSPVHCQPS